jgi:hypothetical protein
MKVSLFTFWFLTIFQLFIVLQNINFQHSLFFCDQKLAKCEKTLLKGLIHYKMIGIGGFGLIIWVKWCPHHHNLLRNNPATAPQRVRRVCWNSWVEECLAQPSLLGCKATSSLYATRKQKEEVFRFFCTFTKRLYALHEPARPVWESM